MKKTIGILAHVDAGKTTFSEQVLFRMGALRSLGRVDHQDAFLDAHPIEKRRGITIFSDQAVFQAGEDTYYWLDTPGHVDFSPEMERAIDAMDYAIVVVSCVEGVQSHTETVWRLLKKHQVPTFLFLNKIDRAGVDPTAVVEQIRARLSPEAVCCDGLTPDSMPDTLMESIAERDEAALDQLPLREQMLTVLCAIGFEEQVTEALAGEGVSLSEEAEALKEQILARIDAMNEEEKAAFQQMLEENFPVETVEMDGMEYRFFVFEVEIETEEGLRRERYGFREEAGAWIFVKLSVAETAK